MSSDQLVELALTLHTETDKAYLVSDTGIHADAKWVPKSRVSIIERKQMTGTITGIAIEVEMPEWLAADKRFI